MNQLHFVADCTVGTRKFEFFKLMSTHPRGSRHTEWLGPLKGIAILWIFLNHLSERIFGSPFISNPNAAWPPLAERIQQLAPLDFGSPASDVVLNLVRYLGWAGDQGVQLFLIASGFGLMWSVQQRDAVEGYWSFLSRRMLRIYPLWWGAHLFFLGLSVFVGQHGMLPFDPKFYISMIGFRATTQMIYYFSPAWWFIGLILQLYLAFPLLARWLRRVGVARFMLWIVAGSFLIRMGGLYAFEGYLDAWSRGAVFVTRLPEFALGMALAVWLFDRPGEADRVLRNPWLVPGALLGYAAATGLALTLWGMTVAPFLHGAAVFVLFHAVFLRPRDGDRRVTRVLAWMGGISYSLYLTHHPVTAFLVDQSGIPTLSRVALGVPALAIAVVVALLLERAVGWVEGFVVEATPRKGVGWVMYRLVAAAAVAAGILLGTEASVRHFNPQEANGWGERPSLEPHPVFGWRLIPSSTTRLRWETYDYVLEANELGFPGPSYQEARSPGSIRIMALGDAFTSAEGVDTRQSWPRVLEGVLRDRLGDTDIEVLNFAITGYGPNQYAAVFREFGPRYRPDLVLIGTFVNEFFDVLLTNESFQSSIGFGLPAQDSLRSYLEAAQARKLLQHRITDPLRELLTRTPRPYGYFLGNFRAFDEVSRDELLEGAELVRRRLAEIESTAASIGAEVIVILIPASIQVCDPRDLSYFPRVVDLGDHERFDLDRPQASAREIAEDLNIVTLDLRGPLSALEECPYQPWNMHWLPEGHRVVASFLADVLIRDGHIRALSSPVGDH